MRPLVYEINTWCWLNELSTARGRTIDLGSVPAELPSQWQAQGFSHIWLMGVWSTGPRSRATYLTHPDTAPRLHRLLPGWNVADVNGSPYAIAEYRAAPALGGERGLETFRAQLERQGLKLLLDFVPNHLGLDHPWVTEQPDLFVQAVPESPGAFAVETSSGPRWLAHGKDPNFPAWNDTAQLDHRRKATRAAVIAQLQAVAARCDGVRCDMAMLLLSDVFARNWDSFPGSGPVAPGEFWEDALAAVQRPGFLFMAEAYWDLEARLQEMGFDYTYDKRVTDFLMDRRPHELARHLIDKGDPFRQRSVHFLENHDERRVATRLSPAEHRVAALLILALPGLCLLHEGQLTGARVRVPVHLARRPAEPVDAVIAALYAEWLGTLAGTWVGRGRGEILVAADLIAVGWHGDGAEADVVALNLRDNPAQARVRLPGNLAAQRSVDVMDGFGSGARQTLSEEVCREGLWMELPAYGTRLLRITSGAR